MAITLRRLMQKEKGQALVEYQVLIPGAIFLAIVAAWLIAPRVSDWYCQTVVGFDPDACEVAQAAEATPDPTEDPEEELACFVLQEEEGGSQCDQDPDCTKLPGVNTGTWESGDQVEVFVIKAGRDYHVFETTTTEDGCYHVTIEPTYVSWTRVGNGPHCKDISHIQNWFIPRCE